MLESIVHTMLGNRTEAIRQLDLYYTANPQLRAALARDESWWWKDLRADPRWREIARDRAAAR
jgi:hypothetical protein